MTEEEYLNYEEEHDCTIYVMHATNSQKETYAYCSICGRILEKI